MYSIDFRSRAYENMEKIELYYNSIDTTLFESFKYEFYKILDVVSIFPKIYQLSYRNIRIGFLENFSYAIHYEVREQDVVIHAILHTSQEQNMNIK